MSAKTGSAWPMWVSIAAALSTPTVGWPSATSASADPSGPAAQFQHRRPRAEDAADQLGLAGWAQPQVQRNGAAIGCRFHRVMHRVMIGPGFVVLSGVLGPRHTCVAYRTGQWRRMSALTPNLISAY